MAKKILVETSARHIHVCEATLKTLFGEGATLPTRRISASPVSSLARKRLRL